MKPIHALALMALFAGGSAIAQAPRVLLIGDSWARQQWEDQSHAVVFAANDVGMHTVVGATTTESGSTAAEWAATERLAIITQALADHPGIDTVQVTIGGNDFLDAWSATMTPAQEQELQDTIVADLDAVIDAVLDHRSDIEVVLSLYDYPNFRDTLGSLVGLAFCAPLNNSLGQPTPIQLNLAMMRFEGALAGLAAHPRVHHVSHAGHMQYTYGSPPDGVLPGQLLPPGDPTLPSPVQAMRDHGFLGRDCFHLTPDGYDVLVQNLYDGYFRVRFDTLFKSSFD